MAPSTSSRPTEFVVSPIAPPSPRRAGKQHQRSYQRAPFAFAALLAATALSLISLIILSPSWEVLIKAESNSWEAFEEELSSAERLGGKQRGSATAVKVASSQGLPPHEQHTVPPSPPISSSDVDHRRLDPDHGATLPQGLILPRPNPQSPLDPAFRCLTPASARDRPSKLVFVHIFKTAGSHLRHLFVEYARRCYAGFALAVHCPRDFQRARGILRYNVTNGTSAAAAVAAEDVRNALRKCSMKWKVPRSGGNRTEGKMPPNNYSRKLGLKNVRQNVDILAGHFQIGAGEAIWGDDDDDDEVEYYDGRRSLGATVKLGRQGPVMDEKDSGEAPLPPSGIRGSPQRRIRYVAFARNALNKFISGLQFRNRQKLKKAGPIDKLPRLVRLIRDTVRSDLADGMYDFSPGYGGYLRTREQWALRRNQSGRDTFEERALEVIMNLIKYDVTVGVTERMSDSLQLVARLIDPGGEAGDIFRRFGMNEREAATEDRRRLEGKEEERSGNNSTRHGVKWVHYNTGGFIRDDERIIGRTRDRESKSFDGDANDAVFASHKEGKKINKASVPTSQLLGALRNEDGMFFAQLLDYVRYEQQITDLALAMHLRQHRGAFHPHPFSSPRVR